MMEDYCWEVQMRKNGMIIKRRNSLQIIPWPGWRFQYGGNGAISRKRIFFEAVKRGVRKLFRTY